VNRSQASTRSTGNSNYLDNQIIPQFIFSSGASAQFTPPIPLGGRPQKDFASMIKSLAAAAILAVGLSGIAFAQDATPAAAPAAPAAPVMKHHKSMGSGHMCYHTVKGVKHWHHCHAAAMPAAPKS
jgi:hypothetical protein